MPKIKIFMVLCVAGALLGSGCMSSRMVTNLKPANNAELKSPAGTFYVAHVKLITEPDSSPQVIEAYNKYQRQLLPILRKECAERYPALFLKEATAAIPLSVTAETTTTHAKLAPLWILGTLTIVGVILPCPDQMDEDVILKAGVWRGYDDVHAPTLQKDFHRETHLWLSLLTPLGLITIPGASDFPKTSASILNMQQGEQDYLKQLAAQFATALAEIVAAKDPEFWTSQLRTGTSSILSPARPSVTPVTPLPTETDTPF